MVSNDSNGSSVSGGVGDDDFPLSPTATVILLLVVMLVVVSVVGVLLV